MAVRALSHYALEIPDQTVGEKFYRRFGLIDEPTTGGNAVRLRPVPLARNVVLLYGGPKKRLHHHHIPENCACEPRDIPPGDALYRWGPPVPDDFGLNRELEG